MPDATFAGTLKVSSTSNVTQQALSLSALCSVFTQEEFVVSLGVANLAISFATISNPSVVFMTSTDLLLVNAQGIPSSPGVSNGFYLNGFLGIMASGQGTGLSGLRVGNSGATSATLTVLLGQ
jgi:hypothetical protein